MKTLVAYPHEGDNMKSKISTDGFPPNQKYRFVHTAVLEGIAVFFCSTPFLIFYSYFPIFTISKRQNAFAVKRVRFLNVRKSGFLLCNSLFCSRKSNAGSILCRLKPDKHFLVDEKGQADFLEQWQAFIGKYP